jgi:uncharacterized RDD family membrane protein YckC
VTQPSDDAAEAVPGQSPPHGYGPPQGYGPPLGYGHVPPGYRPPPVALSPGGRPLADFGTRLAAFAIDGAILSVAVLILAAPAMVAVIVIAQRSPDFMFAPGPDGAEPDLSVIWQHLFLPLLAFQAYLFVVLLATQYIYHVEMMWRSGQTLGKKVMKLKIIPLDPSRVLTRRDAAGRWAVERVAGFVIPFFSTVDGLWQLWDQPYRQTLHDKAVSTIVVKVPS